MIPPLQANMFAILSSLIEEKAGIHYDASSKDVLEAKLEGRLAETGFESWLDYYYYLRYDPEGEAEVQRLIEALVVHETYLFRELDQLEVMIDRFVAPAAARAREAGRRVRLWSAACSTGEEPYTVALLLAERKLLGNVEIVASDVSAAALARAREGRVGRRSLRALPAAYERSRWLELNDAGARVAPEVLDAIRFQRVNLLDGAAIAQLGVFDVVLCRNVLIYFQDDRARQVVTRLGEALAPGGALFAGVSESLMRFGTSFTCEEQGGIFYYRKTGEPR